MNLKKLLAAGVVVAVGVGALGAATGAGAAKAKKAKLVKESQAITIGAEEFPPVLNDMTPQGNSQWTAMIVGPALAFGHKLLPDVSYEPWIFSKDCDVLSNAPFTVDCQLRPEARWSDGVALTAS